MPAQIEIQELLEAIRTDGPQKVVQQYRHNLLPSRLLIDLYSEYPEHDVLLFLALYPTVPSQVLEDLAESCTNPDIQAAAATNPRCTHLLLVHMAREGGAPVRAALAANKLQNSKITAELLNDSNLFVRTALAGNAAINPSYRTALALDPEPAVRTALAGSTKLPAELVHALSADDSAVVRANLFAYGKVDDETLLDWAHSDDAETQRCLLSRKLSPELIEALTHSPDPLAQETVQPLHVPSPQELLAKAESEHELLRMEAAQYEKLPAEIQHVIAADPQAEVRAALAGNPCIDEEVALCIAASNDPVACSALAKNPHLTDAVKIELCHHESDEVRLQMAYREDLTDALLDILVNGHDDPNLIAHLAQRPLTFGGTAEAQLEKLLKHKRPSLRRFAAGSTQLNHTQVRKLMRDDSADVRQALCSNPILTRLALEELARDWNPGVAAAAQTHLKNRPEDDPADEQQPPFEEDGKGLVSRIVRFFAE